MRLTKQRSLAQELADLSNPAPTKEHDPDALDLGDGAKLASDDEYEEACQAPLRRAPEKAMLLRGDIDLEDAAYRGRRTSRAAVFGEQNGDADGDDDDDEESDLDEDADDGDADNGAGVSGEGGEEEDQEDGVRAERRTGSGRSGPSRRNEAAAAAAAAARDPTDRPDGRTSRPTNAGKGAKSGAALTNGAGPHSFHGGEEDKGEDGGKLRSGSGSDLDSANPDGLGVIGDDDDDDDEEEGGDEEEDEDKGPRTRGRAGGHSGSRGGGGGELEDLEAEYEALQEEDERQLAALRQKGERDREKGVAVRNQQALYERALEQRILLQKCLQASNGLPRPDTHAALVAAHPDVREGYAALAAAACDTLRHLLDLQHTLMARNAVIKVPPATAAAAGEVASRPSKRRRPSDANDDSDGVAAKGAADSDSDADEEGGREGLESLWRRISSQHEALAPFRDVSLDSWHRRTVLSSGGGALRNTGLRALNQSISSQVQALMRDPAKFVRRTRLVLSACPRVLCEPPRVLAAAAATALDPMAGDADPDSAAAAISASMAADLTDEERDPETYDDAEFYQQLLKEFLDKGLAEGAVAAPKSAKKRKLVDRRASKGRKLRYHVQEKLVAFMAPVDFTPPPFAANLFSNLFGHASK